MNRSKEYHSETALDHGEVVLEARAVAAALRTRSRRREPASEPRDRPDEVLSICQQVRQSAPVDLLKPSLNPISRMRRPEYMPHPLTYRMPNEEKWAVNAVRIVMGTPRIRARMASSEIAVELPRNICSSFTKMFDGDKFR